MKESKINLVIPVFNEEKILKKNVEIVNNFLTKELKDENITIIIAENGSTDNTYKIALELAKKNNNIIVERFKEKGRGNAVKKSWMKSYGDILIYMDMDLSTELLAIPRTISKIREGNDLVIGSRHQEESKVNRSRHRSCLSKTYNFIVKLFFDTKIKDMQCGFKAINNKIRIELLPTIKDTNWFFDTELILKAEKKGYKIAEIPIQWSGNKNTKVNIIKTIFEYLTNLIKLKYDMKK